MFFPLDWPLTKSPINTKFHSKFLVSGCPHLFLNWNDNKNLSWHLVFSNWFLVTSRSNEKYNRSGIFLNDNLKLIRTYIGVWKGSSHLSVSDTLRPFVIAANFWPFATTSLLLISSWNCFAFGSRFAKTFSFWRSTFFRQIGF